MKPQFAWQIPRSADPDKFCGKCFHKKRKGENLYKNPEKGTQQLRFKFLCGIHFQIIKKQMQDDKLKINSCKKCQWTTTISSLEYCPKCGTPFDFEMEKDERCQTCGGTGEVSKMEQVYPNEPHMADIGFGPCPDCRGSEPDDFSGATEGDR